MEIMNAEQKIQNAFLQLIRKYRFSEITVTMLCQEAGISRTSFYKHFSNTAEVLDEALRTLFLNVDGVQTELLGYGKVEGVPLCVFVRTHPQLRNLFTDDTIIHTVIRKFVSMNRKEYLDVMHRRVSSSDDELIGLLYFQLNGCMHAIRHTISRSDDEWAANKKNIDSFILSGFKNLPTR